MKDAINTVPRLIGLDFFGVFFKTLLNMKDHSHV